VAFLMPFLFVDHFFTPDVLSIFLDTIAQRSAYLPKRYYLLLL
jgi:hypothetical protein